MMPRKPNEKVLDDFITSISAQTGDSPESIAATISAMHHTGYRPIRGITESGILRLSELLGVSHQRIGQISFKPSEVDSSVYNLIPSYLITRHKVAPIRFDQNSGELILAFSSSQPLSTYERSQIQELIPHHQIKYAIASRNEITALISHMQGQVEAGADDESESQQARLMRSIEKYDDLAGGHDPTSRDVRSLLTSAIAANASDIHLSTISDEGEETVLGRLRIDGQLIEHERYTVAKGNQIFARFRQASLKTSSVVGAADGQCDITFPDGGGRFDMRLAFVPLRVGQMMVIRMLPQERPALSTLDELYPVSESNTAEMFKKALSFSHGIVLCSGPTGSGKSTTLAAALAHVATPDKKVCTVEDPVESLIAGAVEQIPVTQHVTFAKGLRALLRCDPDVMMIGEIRDQETAITAIEASKTGHMILSTVHSTSAADTASRLVDLGVSSQGLAEQCRLVIAQRLARRLCKSCSAKGVPKGCDLCRDGYSGRVAVSETLEFDHDVQDAIQQGMPPRFVKTLPGFTPFQVHAEKLIERKITTRNEIDRILEW